MEKQNLRKVFEAIKSDDLKSFTSLMLSKSDLNISFGRFPILSLCYLYKADAILNVYERYLTPINKFEIVPEYFEIYRKFKKHAKRSIRLFASKERVVYPIEMLGILDARNLVAKKYKILFKNEEILNNLQKIYNFDRNIEIIATREKFECSRKKMTLMQKILAGCMAVMLCLFSVFSIGSVLWVNNSFGKGTKESPIYISNEAEFISAMKRNDKYYVLKNDIVLSKEIMVSSFKGTLDGDGFSLTIFSNSKMAFIEEMSGTIQNLNISFSSKEMVFGANYSIFAKNNTGTIQNCTFLGEISGVVNSAKDAYVSVVAHENNGNIDNVKVAVSATVSNQGQTNAYLAGIAGINKKTISNSETVSGNFEADTVDLAGIAAENYGIIENVSNNIKLVQTSNKEWHPNCAGVSMINYGVIKNSKNNAEIFAQSTRADKSSDGSSTFYVIAGGIACDNYYVIENCRNNANISAVGDISHAVVGGIVATNTYADYYGLVKKSKSTSKLTAKSKQNPVYIGGVVGQNQGEVMSSGFEGVIDAHSDINDSNTIVVYAGGVVGFNKYVMHECYADVIFENPTPNNKDDDQNEISTFLYGGLTGCANVTYYVAHNGSNNHYVKNSTIGAGGYWFILDFLTGNLQRVSKVTNDTEYYIEHDLIDEIPEGVRIYE